MLTRKSRYVTIGAMLALPLLMACEDPLGPTDSRPELEVQVNPVDPNARPRPAQPGSDSGGGKGGIEEKSCPLDSHLRADGQRVCS